MQGKPKTPNPKSQTISKSKHQNSKQPVGAAFSRECIVIHTAPCKLSFEHEAHEERDEHEGHEEKKRGQVSSLDKYSLWLVNGMFTVETCPRISMKHTKRCIES